MALARRTRALAVQALIERMRSRTGTFADNLRSHRTSVHIVELSPTVSGPTIKHRLVPTKPHGGKISQWELNVYLPGDWAETVSDRGLTFAEEAFVMQAEPVPDTPVFKAKVLRVGSAGFLIADEFLTKRGATVRAHHHLLVAMSEAT